VGELLWFLSGSTDDNKLKALSYIAPDKNSIWSANAEDFLTKGKASYKGDLGRIYGFQWRSWNGATGYIQPIDQITQLVKRLREDPFSRYHLVTAWNPSDIPHMALPACHVMFQVFCHVDGGLSLSMIQRSCDTFLGVPYNIASYALLTHMLAHVTGREARELIITFQDVHIYEEHFDVVMQQIRRRPFKLPSLQLNHEVKELTDFTMKDIVLIGYEHHEALKAKMIV